MRRHLATLVVDATVRPTTATYMPFIGETDQPAIFLNEEIITDEWRERMRPYYYDPSRFDTHVEQLGITYPTVRPEPTLQQQ